MNDNNSALSSAIRIAELFSSIQGESTYAGRPCFFVRLSGCPYRCSYCDTLFAQDFTYGREYSIPEIIAKVKKSNLPLVEITGGEPLAQKNVLLLFDALIAEGLEVMLETNGGFDISEIPPAVKRILDCKLPSSQMADRNLYTNYQYLTPHDEVKFVVGSREDYEFALNITQQYDLPSKTKNLLISPVWGTVAFENIVEWILADNAPFRFQLQMHKIIWGANKQGV